MQAVPFIGRSHELSLLQEFFDRRLASLIVITGRRRIGKSRLVEEFAQSFPRALNFIALPPTKTTTSADQRAEFARQLAEQLQFPELKASDWAQLFSTLVAHTKEGRTLIFFDEISWMAGRDRTFLGKLKNAWDTGFKKNPQLVLVLCGSVSSWIEKNLLSATGFVGRVSQILKIRPLPLRACTEFWGAQRERVSAREKLKLLAITGGIPRYLEEIEPHLSAEQNINRLCFREGALLLDEFERLFPDLFGRRHTQYRRIVSLLVDRHLNQKQINTKLQSTKGGTLSQYLDDLVTAGFVARDYTWKIKTGQYSKLSSYRLCDNYVRFYLKYIAPNRVRIEQGSYPDSTLQYLPGWHSIMGLQFENLVLSNRDLIYDALQIDKRDVIASNPFLQRKDATSRGVQVDLLIQTRFQTLYLCEIKFGSKPVRGDVIDEVTRKCARLVRPKYFSLRPVLIHAGEISEAVVDSRYFDKIIDIAAVL